MNKRDSILKGTALLTGAGLIVKLLGAAYRIPLSRLIGSEGIGLYQMAYPVYLMFLSLSTAGLPIAISKIIAEESVKGNRYGIKQVFRAALILLLLLGCCGTLVMIGLAPWLANKVVADPRAVFPIWALAPAIFFMSLTSAFRGFFQGQQQMAPTAISQIIEQTVRVGVSLILAFLLLKTGIEHAAAGAAFGATAGGAAGLIFLTIIYWSRGSGSKIAIPKGYHHSIWHTMRQLIKFALPISLAVILMPLLQTLDSIIVPAKLQSIGYTVRQATSMLGVLGNSWAILYLPMIVTAAISSNLVPSIASFKATGINKVPGEKIQEGLRLAVYYLIPVAILLYLFGKTIYQVIYGTTGITILSWLAPAVVFLGLEQVSAGILQGLGQPNVPLLNFIVGAIIKIGVTVVTTGWPGFNLAGAALGTVCGSALTASLNLIAIKRLINLKLTFIPVGILGGIILLISGWYLKRQLPLDYFWQLMVVGILGMLLYLGTLWLGGGIKSNDLEVVNKLIQKRRTGNGYRTSTKNSGG